MRPWNLLAVRSERAKLVFTVYVELLVRIDCNEQRIDVRVDFGLPIARLQRILHRVLVQAVQPGQVVEPGLRGGRHRS